jgi:four helix bundle protein
MITQFEDLRAWQRARVLTKEIYKATKKNDFSRDYRFASQIQSAAVSVMANIAEGFDRYNRKEFHQFLSIAKSSCAEVRSHLYVALDIEYLAEQEFTELQNLSKEVSNIVGALRASVQKKIPKKNKRAD